MTCLELASWLAHHSCFCARRFTSLGIFQVTNGTFRLDSSFFLLVNNSWYTFSEVLTSSIHRKLELAGAGTFKNHAPLWITRPWRHPCRSFTVTQQKKNISNRPVEEVKKMKCYKRLIYKQFVLSKSQVFVAHRFWDICPNVSRTFVPFWCTNMAAGTQQKHLEFTFSIKALSFLSRTSIRAHKHSTGMETSIKIYFLFIFNLV